MRHKPLARRFGCRGGPSVWHCIAGLHNLLSRHSFGALLYQNCSHPVRPWQVCIENVEHPARVSTFLYHKYLRNGKVHVLSRSYQR